jgi:hypothetical protein
MFWPQRQSMTNPKPLRYEILYCFTNELVFAVAEQLFSLTVEGKANKSHIQKNGQVLLM